MISDPNDTQLIKDQFVTKTGRTVVLSSEEGVWFLSLFDTDGLLLIAKNILDEHVLTEETATAEFERLRDLLS